jgi:uncharacterized coiled-coil protein SlyX
MKALFAATLVLFTLSAAHAQDARPTPNTNLKVTRATPEDTRLNDMEHKYAALEAKLTSLASENATQKEQISQLKTSVKALDMVLTDTKAKYENHVHFTGNYRISGFYAQKLNPNGMPLKFLTTQQAESAPQYSGKPEAGK